MPAHPHAELMALYAKDATETDVPWERWEWFHSHSNLWLQCNKHPSWQLGNKYRRKPERRWYRVALMKTSDNHYHPYTVTSTESSWETRLGFYKWLTDRIYYDVE